MVTIIVQIHEIIDYHNKIQVIRPALKKKYVKLSTLCSLQNIYCWEHKDREHRQNN